MAAIVQTIVSGDRNLVLHVIGEGDTASTTIVDVSALAANSQGEAVTKVRLDEISWKTDAIVMLDWDADTDLTFMVLTAGQETTDYRSAGGLNNNAGTGVTGDVKLVADGGGSSYSMTLYFTKKYS